MVAGAGDMMKAIVRVRLRGTHVLGLWCVQEGRLLVGCVSCIMLGRGDI